ncbi:MAG TPA: hypothetical protein VH678_28460 [Xanthobacteraceae bacterium]|jgi:hypothetical protein
MRGLRLIEGAAFDPDTTELMGRAYEQSCRTLAVDNFAARELVATRIIEAARRGERDPDKLAAYGLEGLSGPREAGPK